MVEVENENRPFFFSFLRCSCPQATVFRTSLGNRLFSFVSSVCSHICTRFSLSSLLLVPLSRNDYSQFRYYITLPPLLNLKDLLNELHECNGFELLPDIHVSLRLSLKLLRFMLSGVFFVMSENTHYLWSSSSVFIKCKGSHTRCSYLQCC